MTIMSLKILKNYIFLIYKKKKMIKKQKKLKYFNKEIMNKINKFKICKK